MQPPGKDGTEEDREWLNLPGATEAEEEDFYLLPENHKAWELFCACSTQWRVGMAGPTGLDYPAVESVMRIFCVKQKHQKDLLWRIQHLERGALAAWSDKANG